jgi:Pup amidohydrolase
MSIPKAAGIETEYGIIVRGDPASNPFWASQLVLSAHPSGGVTAIPTSMYYHGVYGSAQATVEAAATDIYGDSSLAYAPAVGSAAASKAQVIQYGLGSLMLANGARFYIDHAHPEYCTPETLSPRRVVAADKAGERIVARCTAAANQGGMLPPGQQVLLYKNNSDQKGNSYGCHENYLLSVDLFENLLRRRTHLIFRYLLPFQISRVVLCGAGKVGYENRTAPATFQLAQRADFFEMLTGIQTTHRRPLFNQRDESHAAKNTFRRLHVILGDANLSEIATYLKIGTLQLVLHMIEDGFLAADLTLADPVGAFRQVSRDLTFREPLRLENGALMTALDIQETYLALAEQYLDERGGTDEQWHVWETWAAVLDALAAGDRDFLATRLDWAIKKNVLDRYLVTQNTTWETVAAWQPVIEAILAAPPAEEAALVRMLAAGAGLSPDDYAQQREIYFGLRRLDLEYHDIRADGDEAGLFYRLQARGLVERLLDDAEIEAMITQPPPDTRAWLRGKTVEKFAADIVGADWSYIKLRHPDPAANLVYRLELPNPLVGTEAELAGVWDGLHTPEDLMAIFRHDRR